MSTAVLTPYSTDLATAVPGRLWRKQLLPVGQINYKGRRLDFSRDYLASLADAFKAKAYDSVKLLFAPSDNSHTMDPERVRGTVRDLELADDGLYGYLELSDDGEKIIREHPDIGVSAQIVEGLARADGKSFPRAIRHVLATLDPRVTGMKPWEAVNLANETDMAVVDLTSAEFSQEGATMPELTEEEIAKLRELLSKSDGDGTEVTPTPEPANKADELSDEELNAALAELVANEEREPAGAGAELSAEAQEAINLATAQAEQARQEVDVIKRQAMKAAWVAERDKRLRDGVPPALLDLAAPWCGDDAPDGFIDLSNADTTVDSVREAAAKSFRQMLDTFSGLIDMSVIGAAPQEEPDESEARQKSVKEYAEAHGL